MIEKVFNCVLGKDDRYTKYMIHNVRGLYELCREKGKEEEYKGVLIGDILVDAENAHVYADGIAGFRIVETAFCQVVDREPALIMKCPVDGKEALRIKIIFENKRTFVRHYFSLTDAERTTPIVIAGEWEKSPDESDFQCQCLIRRAKQIYYVD